jgi:hypothetical protein
MKTSAPVMEAEGDSGVVAGSGVAVDSEGAMAEGVDWVAEVGAGAEVDLAAVATQEFMVHGSVVLGLHRV